MFRIGIVDDNKDRIEEIETAFDLAFPEGPPKISDPDVVEGEIWELISTEPLDDPEFYLHWIIENEIRVLIIDVNLREGSPGILYDGPDVIDLLATKMPKFPIVVVTNYPKSENLMERFSVVTDIIDRKEWNQDGPKLAKRIVNFGELYNNVFEEKIDTIDELAEKVASETASPEEIAKLQSLQHQLEVMSTDEKNKIEGWMNEMESASQNLSELEKKVEEVLKKLQEKNQ